MSSGRTVEEDAEPGGGEGGCDVLPDDGGDGETVDENNLQAVSHEECAAGRQGRTRVPLWGPTSQ